MHDLAICLSIAISALTVAWPLWSISDILWEIYARDVKEEVD